MVSESMVRAGGRAETMSKLPQSMILGPMVLGLGLGCVSDQVRGESLVEAWSIALPANAGLAARSDETAAADRNLTAARQAWIPTVRTFNLDTSLTTTPKLKFASQAGFTGASTGAAAGAAAGGAAATAAAVAVPIFGADQTNLPLSFTAATVPIYTGGRIINTIRAADSLRNAQRSEQCRSALDLKVTVAEAYIGILRARRNLEVAESNVARLDSFARDIRNRKREGLATRNDELSAEVALANAKLGVIQARNRKRLPGPPTTVTSAALPKRSCLWKI